MRWLCGWFGRWACWFVVRGAEYWLGVVSCGEEAEAAGALGLLRYSGWMISGRFSLFVWVYEIHRSIGMEDEAS